MELAYYKINLNSEKFHFLCLFNVSGSATTTSMKKQMSEDSEEEELI